MCIYYKEEIKMARNTKFRNPGKVLKKLQRLGTPELREALRRELSFAAPEQSWEIMSACVNAHVTPSSKNARSVAVYAALCGCNWWEMRRRFKEKNL